MSAAEAKRATAVSETGEPVVADVHVAHLPDVVFGARDLTWWGTASFMVIEGMTLAVVVGCYFYLWRNFPTWPPPGIRPPDLALGTVGVALYLLSIPPMYLLSRSARRMDLAGTRRWLAVGCVLVLLFAVVRAFEFRTLNVHWRETAYGSLLWTLLGVHGTLVATEVAEVLGITAVMYRDDTVEPKHFTDASDVAFYWYFLVGSWLPAYALVYLLPRLA